MRSVTVNLAWRNLSRKRRRTLLSVAGVAVSCALSLVTIGYAKGKIETFVRATAEGGVGHLRLVPEEWMKARDPKWRLHDWRRELAVLRDAPGVLAAAPRLRAQGMIAMGAHAVGVEVVGVDPATEPKTLRFVRQVASGRYLDAAGRNEMVLGQGAADTLKIEAGDLVVATVVGTGGDMQSDMFTVVGLVRTGIDDVDAALCQVNMPDLERLTGQPGAGEITLILKDYRKAPELQSALSARLSPKDRLMRWDQIAPESRRAVEINGKESVWLTAILMIVALMGVASAQLTAVLERRRELAMLAAVGMSARRLSALIFLEGAVLGVLGAVGALVLAVPVDYYLATAGIDLGSNIQFSSMALDPVFRSDFDWWLVAYASILSLVTSLLASAYPAWFVSRQDPISAMRVSQ